MPAAPRLAPGRCAAGVLCLRQSQCICAGFCAGARNFPSPLCLSLHVMIRALMCMRLPLQHALWDGALFPVSTREYLMLLGCRVGLEITKRHSEQLAKRARRCAAKTAWSCSAVTPHPPRLVCASSGAPRQANRQTPQLLFSGKKFLRCCAVHIWWENASGEHRHLANHSALLLHPHEHTHPSVPQQTC